LSDAQVSTLLFKLLRTGCQWRELECGTASFMAVYRRVQLWERTRVIEDAYQRALQTYSKLRPPKRHLMDSSHVRNRHGRQPHTGRNHVDRGRQGTKVSVVTDDTRVIYGVHLAPSNRPDVVLLDDTLDSRWVKVDGIELWADRGYDSRANRQRCADRNVKDRIFRRKTKTTRKSNASTGHAPPVIFASSSLWLLDIGLVRLSVVFLALITRWDKLYEVAPPPPASFQSPPPSAAPLTPRQ